MHILVTFTCPAIHTYILLYRVYTCVLSHQPTYTQTHSFPNNTTPSFSFTLIHLLLLIYSIQTHTIPLHSFTHPFTTFSSASPVLEHPHPHFTPHQATFPLPTHHTITYPHYLHVPLPLPPLPYPLTPLSPTPRPQKYPPTLTATSITAPNPYLGSLSLSLRRKGGLQRRRKKRVSCVLAAHSLSRFPHPDACICKF